MIPKEVASSSSNQLSESEYSINRLCSGRKKKEEEGVRIDASSLHGEEEREEIYSKSKGRLVLPRQGKEELIFEV